MNRLSVWGKGEKIEALHVVELGRAKALVDLVSDLYFVEKVVSLHPESFAGILKAIRDSSNRARLYIFYRGAFGRPMNPHCGGSCCVWDETV